MDIFKTLSEKCSICTDQDHPWATKISKQYLLHTKLENLLFWWSWKMDTAGTQVLLVPMSQAYFAYQNY
jgi:hypothetical protein